MTGVMNMPGAGMCCGGSAPITVWPRWLGGRHREGPAPAPRTSTAGLSISADLGDTSNHNTTHVGAVAAAVTCITDAGTAGAGAEAGGSQTAATALSAATGAATAAAAVGSVAGGATAEA